MQFPQVASVSGTTWYQPLIGLIEEPLLGP